MRPDDPRWLRPARLACWVAVAITACDSRGGWPQAEALWRRGESAEAWRAWVALGEGSPEGRAARRRLDEADLHYRRAIEMLRLGSTGVREEIDRAMAIAPMDPRLYLPLARACRARGYAVRAVDFYRKFLEADVGEGGDLADARRELGALAGGAEIFPTATAAAAADEDRRSLLVAALALSASAFVAGVAVRLRRRGRRSLGALAAGSPELHPTIAYLVGSLRHELLKHRIGAVLPALQAVAVGDDRSTTALREFALGRLLGGEPLEAAWGSHVAGIERALSLGSLERRDPAFRRAGRSLRQVRRWAQALARGDRGALGRLLAAVTGLQELDRELAAVAAGLRRCTVDEAFLREAIDSVRGEYEAGAVPLDELRLTPPPPGITVEVYPMDLRIIVKNVVRNAILAVGRDRAPRRVAVSVRVEPEPTGEETVRVQVGDTSPEALTTPAIQARRIERGLGLVTAALARYQGAIDVTEGPDGFAKTVEVRLFRALDDEAQGGGLPLERAA